MTFTIYNKDSTLLSEVLDSSIDAVITDPPYGINFQGNAWDKGLPDIKVWQNCFRVLKPGAFMLVFSSIKYMHKLMFGVESCGFEIKDVLFWVHLNGLPKNRNIALDIDKELGVESEIIGEYKYSQGYKKDKPNDYKLDDTKYIKNPKSELALKYVGAGMNLKPAYEPIIMFQKPILESSVAKNILKYGVGALNLEESRIPYNKNENKVGHNPHNLGRMPTNILRDEKFDDNYDKFFVIPKVRKKESVLNHPTQKPLALMEHLVKLVSFENFKVLDPFMGLGSSGIACIKNNRDFIGYEIDEKYFKLAQQNLQKYNKLPLQANFFK